LFTIRRRQALLSRDSDGAVRSNENKILVTMRITGLRLFADCAAKKVALAGQDNTKKTSWFQNIKFFVDICVR